jgi:hypothetical protein
MTAVSALDAFERDFAAALLADPGRGDAGALASQPGFAVYRNTVLRGCIDALAANHPTVVQLVGLEWFEGAAAAFARARPPQDGSLARYGDGFAEHLAAWGADDDLPYLAGVARLDRLWMESHLSADAPVLPASALAGLSPDALAAAVVVPHPAARWARFADAPAFTIWRRHRDGTPLDAEIDWRAEGALLTRPGDAVAWRAIDAPGIAFLDACARGLRFDAAAEAASAASASDAIGGVSGDAIDDAVSFASTLPALFAAGAFTRLAGAPA